MKQQRVQERKIRMDLTYQRGSSFVPRSHRESALEWSLVQEIRWPDEAVYQVLLARIRTTNCFEQPKFDTDRAEWSLDSFVLIVLVQCGTWHGIWRLLLLSVGLSVEWADIEFRVYTWQPVPSPLRQACSMADALPEVCVDSDRRPELAEWHSLHRIIKYRDPPKTLTNLCLLVSLWSRVAALRSDSIPSCRIKVESKRSSCVYA